MNRKVLWLLAFFAIVLSVAIFKYSKHSAQPAPNTSSQSENQSSPETVVQQKTGSLNEPSPARQVAALPADVPPARTLLPKLNPVDVASEQRRIRGSFEKYKSSKELKLPNGRFDVLTLRAVEKSDYRREYGNIISQKLNYYLVDSSTLPPGSRPVVVNRSNGMIGIMTGTLLARVGGASSESIDQLAQSMSQVLSLRLLHVDQSIGLIYFSVPADQAPKALESIQKYPSIASASLEIISYEEKF